MLKIAFYQPHIDIRGTGVAYFDYAYYNQTLLGNKSFMIYDKGDHRSHPLAIKKFENSPVETIAIEGLERMDLLEKKLQELEIDAVYIAKNGKKNDGRHVGNIPMLIHVNGREFDPHGLVYAYISEWGAKKYSNGQCPVVPHMINLPEHEDDFRDEFNIPKHATVIARLGGYDAWNLSFVNDAIINILKKRDDIFFLFARTHKFIDHPRVIHMGSFADLYTKRRFINTSDAFLHASSMGESFGIACGEFSLCNKPVMVYTGDEIAGRAHIDILGDKALRYKNYDNVFNTLMTFYPEPEKDWNAYRDYTPDIVMQKFNKIFLEKL